jgi:hypothetical protein
MYPKGVVLKVHPNGRINYAGLETASDGSIDDHHDHEANRPAEIQPNVQPCLRAHSRAAAAPADDGNVGPASSNGSGCADLGSMLARVSELSQAAMDAMVAALCDIGELTPAANGQMELDFGTFSPAALAVVAAAVRNAAPKIAPTIAAATPTCGDGGTQISEIGHSSSRGHSGSDSGGGGGGASREAPQRLDRQAMLQHVASLEQEQLAVVVQRLVELGEAAVGEAGEIELDFEALSAKAVAEVAQLVGGWSGGRASERSDSSAVSAHQAPPDGPIAAEALMEAPVASSLPLNFSSLPARPAAVNSQTHPLFAGATELVVELTAGDAFFLPAGWWHEVTSTAEGDRCAADRVHFAINYWYVRSLALANHPLKQATSGTSVQLRLRHS